MGTPSEDRWNWTEEDLRRVGRKVADLVADHLTNLPDEPVFQPFPKALAERMLREEVPERGERPERILEQFAEDIASYPFGNGHPRFFGWVNSPPAVMGVFAEALAAAMNPSVAGGNHAATYVERQIIGWFKEIMGVPDEAMGLLVSGGSMATLTGLAAGLRAKAGFDTRAKGVQGGEKPLVMYTSEEGHSCIQKAVELLGLGSDNLRRIPVGEHFRMQPEALAEQIEADRAAGLRPVAVAATAGTVNTGAIDPLEEIADVCAARDLWMHVDGAYGLPAILTEEYREALSPVARADSVAVDPHKWMYVPVEAGLVLVRDGEQMREAFSLVPEYIRSDDGAAEVSALPWLSEYGFQQTRGFRALKVWMALKHHGLEGYRAAIAKDNRLAKRLARHIEEAPDLELLAPPSLSIVCFRYRPSEMEAGSEALDQLNRKALSVVQTGGEVFLTATTLREQFALRACIVNPRAGEADVDAIVAQVREAGEKVARGR